MHNSLEKVVGAAGSLVDPSGKDVIRISPAYSLMRVEWARKVLGMSEVGMGKMLKELGIPVVDLARWDGDSGVDRKYVSSSVLETTLAMYLIPEPEGEGVGRWSAFVKDPLALATLMGLWALAYGAVEKETMRTRLEVRGGLMLRDSRSQSILKQVSAASKTRRDKREKEEAGLLLRKAEAESEDD